MREIRASDFLVSLIDFSGKRVLDVGCGDGNLARLMTAKGARVTGLECQPKQLAKALAAAKVGDEDYVDAGAQDMPFPDEEADIVVFFNSLHHVPPEMMSKGLSEAARVLKPNGVLYVSEPVASGPFFELVRPVDDETEARRLAYEAVQAVSRHGLRPESEHLFLHPMSMKSFDEFRQRVVSANHERQALVAAMEAELRANFERLGQKTERGQFFLQPTRANLLRKIV